MTDRAGLAQEIIEVIGDVSAAKLLAERGGTEITVPHRVAGSLLARIIGEADAERLAHYFGAGKLVLPTGMARGAGGRRAKAKELLREGLSLREVALCCDLHIRTVTNYRAELNEDRQDKFDF